MTKTPKQKTFYVEARIGLSTALNISAKTIDEALEKAKQLKVTDFIEIIGDHNDSNFEISGVFAGSGAPEVA